MVTDLNFDCINLFIKHCSLKADLLFAVCDLLFAANQLKAD